MRNRTKDTIAVALMAFALLLLGFLAASSTAYGAEVCPEDGKVESSVDGDLDNIVLDAGTEVCIKGGQTLVTVTADGTSTLAELLGTGQNVSHYTVLETPSTTTTTLGTPSTTVPEPSTTTTQPEQTTTTVPESSTSTTVPKTTTTVDNPTTTVPPSTTVTSSPLTTPQPELPYTGMSPTVWMLLGTALTAGGVTALVRSRNATDEGPSS